ncbi:conserved hypothetical protein [Ricinus communis]|uniref:Uncharacterized protein n=1 Tax=Ricinus communis TaxID=3988 RepID=B9STY9_RICCO|nr:conserved hypothetical protein [Ricinus communis]
MPIGHAELTWVLYHFKGKMSLFEGKFRETGKNHPCQYAQDSGIFDHLCKSKILAVAGW